MRTFYRTQDPHSWKPTATRSFQGRSRTEFTAKLALRTLYAFAALLASAAAMAAYDKPTLVYFKALERAVTSTAGFLLRGCSRAARTGLYRRPPG